jgi:hypothetical protein
MIEFLDTICVEPFRCQSILGISLVGLVWVLSVLVAHRILYKVFYLVDSVTRQTYQLNGQIIHKSFTPAHITTRFTKHGDFVFPLVTNYPDSWDVTIEISESRASVGVTKAFYNRIREKDWVKIEYCIGRFSRSIFIKRVL